MCPEGYRRDDGRPVGLRPLLHIPYDPDLFVELNVERFELSKSGKILFNHPRAHTTTASEPPWCKPPRGPRSHPSKPVAHADQNRCRTEPEPNLNPPKKRAKTKNKTKKAHPRHVPQRGGGGPTPHNARQTPHSAAQAGRSRDHGYTDTLPEEPGVRQPSPAPPASSSLRRPESPSACLRLRTA